jgi:ferric-dicitrate binding protein FerR (iron transport regulator)
MHEDRFWLLVSLKLSGEASPEELAALEEALQANPEWGLQWEILHGLWQRPDTTAGRRPDAVNRHLQRLNNHLSEPVLQYEEPLPHPVEKSRSPRRLWPLTGIAASIAAFFLLYRPAMPRIKQPEIALNTISTKPGSKSRIQLPDGSQVWLNGDSRIVYDERFRGPLREVQISGEAYFDIARDREHPFVIHAASIDIRVLGTSLNIRSYSNEKKTETVLIGGSIEVTLRNRPDKKIILRPNEKLVVQNEDGKILEGHSTPAHPLTHVPVMTLGMAHFREKDTTATEILWTRNKLAFDQETLEDVALKLERWYDIKVIITDVSLRHTAYSAVFEDESLRQVMEALRITGNFKYKINKRTVTFTP